MPSCPRVCDWPLCHVARSDTPSVGTSVRGSLPSGPRVCDWPFCHVARCDASPQGDFVSPLASAGARICLGGSLSGGSAALSGGGSGGSKSALPSDSGIAGVPVLTTGERCVQAASEMVRGDDGGMVRSSLSLSMTRWLTPDCCSSTQGLLSSSTLAVSPAISSSSISSNSQSSGSPSSAHEDFVPRAYNMHGSVCVRGWLTPQDPVRLRVNHLRVSDFFEGVKLIH
jgi:hypothetical protein